MPINKNNEKTDEFWKNKEIELLQNKITNLKEERNRKIKNTSSIKIISICCMALLGILTFRVLFLVLGGLVLSYKSIKDKKSALQWVAGFLSILPIILYIIGFTLALYEEYLFSDDYFDYYYYPYETEGIIFLVLSCACFYAGSICSLIFIINEAHNIDNHFQKKIDDIYLKIEKLS